MNYTNKHFFLFLTQQDVQLQLKKKKQTKTGGFCSFVVRETNTDIKDVCVMDVTLHQQP